MPTPSCHDTSVAVIYTDSASTDGSETLAQDIHAFQRAFWNYTSQPYTGIFNLGEHKRVSEPFAEVAKFHDSTYTAAWVKEHGTFNSGLLELLRYKGATHVIVLGLDVVAIAKGAKENGFQTCVFRPATRGLKEEAVEELKAVGVLVAETCKETMESFVHEVVVDTPFICAGCLELDGPPRWCQKKMGMFLWRTVARMHVYMEAVISRGFEGTGDDPMTSWYKLGVKRPCGYWRCTEKEKSDLLEAIEIASNAGIPEGIAGYVYSFTPQFKKSSREKELEEEIASLRALLEAKPEAKVP
jgi:hypothetical protein